MYLMAAQKILIHKKEGDFMSISVKKRVVNERKMKCLAELAKYQ